MLDTECIRQRTKKLWPRHELTNTDGQADRQTRVYDTSSHDDAFDTHSQFIVALRSPPFSLYCGLTGSCH